MKLRIKHRRKRKDTVQVGGGFYAPVVGSAVAGGWTLTSALGTAPFVYYGGGSGGTATYISSGTITYS